MGPPDGSCPKEIYDIMSKLNDLSNVLTIKLNCYSFILLECCWHINPDKRPSFTNIKNVFGKFYL